nr:hypothetical protein Iba_chr05aCG13940 [Ipomoea batatas]GMC94129.1 hypothetical protein Iba_chr05bCG8920 [Ipomoea batatas]GMC98210.1 hypothetical protein Iba_chr05dCG14400 [Ipomoea batatas]
MGKFAGLMMALLLIHEVMPPLHLAMGARELHPSIDDSRVVNIIQSDRKKLPPPTPLTNIPQHYSHYSPLPRWPPPPAPLRTPLAPSWCSPPPSS